MPKKVSKWLIRRAQTLHEQCETLFTDQSQLTSADVHLLRVSAKELHALWQVLRPFLPKGQVDSASRIIDGAAKLLAGARDQHILLKTLDKLILEASEEELPALQQARELLIAHQFGSPMEVLMSSEIISLFEQDWERWRGLRLDCGRRELVCDGYGRLYRKARKRFRQAAGSRNAEDWHRLRRWTKYLAMALPVIETDSSNQAAAAHFVDLAEKLGDLHDLVVLTASLQALLNPNDSIIQRAIAVVELREEVLQQQCLKKARLIYHARPKDAIRHEFAID